MHASHAPTALSRRDALGAALGSAALFALAGPARAAQPRQPGTPDPLGWDEARGEYTLPDLPYPPEALEPHIDAQTMRIHHTKHHAGYVNGLNKAAAALEQARDASDASLIQHWQRQLAFHAGGHINHTLFWTAMAPSDRAGQPEGALLQAIERDFGTLRKFEWHFKAAAAAVEGSGWGWLAWEPMSRRLIIAQMESQQKLLVPGAIPLLGVDVWEHAYYLRYQNDRGAYLDAFWKVVNWPEVARRFEAASA